MDLPENMQYVIFPTAWGFFGMAGHRHGLCRTCLPLRDRQRVVRHLLHGLQAPQQDPSLLVRVQRQVVAYFEGRKVEFGSDIPLSPEAIHGFALQVLEACRGVGFGHTVTYGDLAAMVGSPGAARAAGSALARNPIPLLIPCHRVIRGNGGLGGFSAPGGLALKQRLLDHELRTGA